MLDPQLRFRVGRCYYKKFNRALRKFHELHNPKVNITLTIRSGKNTVQGYRARTDSTNIFTSGQGVRHLRRNIRLGLNLWKTYDAR